MLVVVAVGCAACSRMQARTLPPVAMNVPPPPPRVAIPVSLPEQPVTEPEPDPPAAPPATPARPRTETAPPRTVIEPKPSAAPATPEGPTPLQTTANVSALAQRATWLLGEAEKALERVNLAQLVPQERAQYHLARGFIRNARNALQLKNFTFAEQLADKAAKLARALVKA
jgi:hypothetical protein